MSAEPEKDPNAEEFNERTDAVKQAFQRLLGDETPVVIWGEPAPRTKEDQP